MVFFTLWIQNNYEKQGRCYMASIFSETDNDNTGIDTTKVIVPYKRPYPRAHWNSPKSKGHATWKEIKS